MAESALDRYFEISARGSDLGREIRGGLVTFLTMAYIVVLNPLILGFTQDVNGRFLAGGAAPQQAASRTSREIFRARHICPLLCQILL